MLTAKEGVLLSNGVFLQDGDFVNVTFIDNEVVNGKIEYFTYDTKGMLLMNKERTKDYDIIFNEFIKDIQLAK